MEGIFETIGAVIKLFVGKDAWRFWIAACFVSWLITIRENYIWPFYIAIFCSIIILLLLIEWIKNFISSSKRAKKLHQVEEERKAALLCKQKADEFTYKNIIWKFFAVVDAKKLDCALELLNFPIIENNEYSRFISREVIEETNLGEALWNTIVSMRIDCGDLSQVNLLEEEQTQYGIYIHFNEYFMKLLLHYKQTGKREFV